MGYKRAAGLEEQQGRGRCSEGQAAAHDALTPINSDAWESRLHRGHSCAAIVEIMHHLEKDKKGRLGGGPGQQQWLRRLAADRPASAGVAGGYLARCGGLHTACSAPGLNPARARPAPPATAPPSICPWRCLQCKPRDQWGDSGGWAAAGGGRRRRWMAAGGGDARQSGSRKLTSCEAKDEERHV